MRKSIARAMAMALLAAALPVAAATLKEDMVALDRAYIPALAITNRASPAPDEARRAMSVLDGRWAAFRRDHGKAAAGDAQWTADLDKIGGLVAAAGKIVASGQDLAKAHEELEGVRLGFLAARTRMNMPYYLDDLTRFHDVMEQIHAAANGKTAATFTETDAAVVQAKFPQAERLWNVVLAGRVDPEFRLTSQQQDRLAELLAVETRAMEALKQALRGGDKAALVKAALGIRGPFSQAYVWFGDFAALGVKQGQ